MKNRIAVIIVNWNGKEDTLGCIRSLQGIRSKHVVDIVVVDNGSTDGSVETFKIFSHPPYIIPLSENLGFTGGNNEGMRYAYDQGYDFVWLLNNDTIVDNQALDPMVSSLAPLRAGIAGSKIYFAPGREFHADRYKKKEKGKVLWYAGGMIDWANMYSSHRGVDEVDKGQYDQTESTDFITGCSMLIRRDVIANIGYLDDRYYLYLEDVDYCLRAKRAGFSLVFVPTSKIWHVNAGSTERPGNELHQYYLTRNRILVGMQYAPLRTKIALLRESFKFLLTASATKKRAVWDALTGQFGNRYVWQQ